MSIDPADEWWTGEHQQPLPAKQAPTQTPARPTPGKQPPSPALSTSNNPYASSWNDDVGDI
jgi:hypothetical protein